MNKIERLVYDCVKRNPGLKLGIRNAYQSLFDLLPPFPSKSAYPISVHEGYFFGFHDHTPFSDDNRKLLAQRFTIGLRMPKPDDTLKIGYFYGKGFSEYCEVSETRAWNWHQGSKLQWLGNKDVMVFNDHIGGKAVARLYDVQSGETRTLGGPIASASPNGDWAVGYNFERVQKYMPGYGYIQDTGDDSIRILAPDQDGLYRINVSSGSFEQIVSIAELAARDPDRSMEGAAHYVSHAVCGPDNKRVLFMHRWVKGDTRGRKERLYACNFDGSGLYRFPTTDMVSHIGWRDRETVFAYCRIAGAGDGYALMTDKGKGHFELIGKGQFLSDGHPSFERSGRWFVTDTYADRTRRRYLVVYDMERSRRYNLAYLRSPKEFATVKVGQHWTCDLHPRWDREGRFICFDSTHTGERSLCIMDLGDVLTSGEEPRQV